MNLSISTIYKAFIQLEAMGLVEARPKSGYYAAPVSLKSIRTPKFSTDFHPPGEVRLSSMINSVVSALNDPTLLPLGSTVVDSGLLPFGPLAGCVRQITKSRMKKMLCYSFSEGYPPLKRHIAALCLGAVTGVAPNDVIITNGCSEAVALALLAVTSPGSVVAIEAPTNFSFLQLLKELGRKVLEVPADPVKGIDPDVLNRLLDQNRADACLFMPNFHNPLGSVMPDENKAAVMEITNKLDIPVVEDDISAELFFKGQRPGPLKAFDKKDLVLTCSSFSKTLAPGLRLGWILPGRRFEAKIQRLKAGANIATSTLDQFLVSRFLEKGGFQRHLRSLRRALKQGAVRTAMAVHKYFPDQTRMAVPRGGSLLWVQLPPGTDGLEVYQEALKQHISIIPGQVCSNSGRFWDHIQISFGLAYTEKVDQGLKTLGGIVARLGRKQGKAG